MTSSKMPNTRFNPQDFPDDVQVIRTMAIEAHGDQLYGDAPYIKHLDEVAYYVLSFGWDYVKLAYCHDLLEDVPKTEDEHRYWEGKILALTDQQFLADCLMLKDEPGHNRKARKALTYQKMQQAGPDFTRALVVKLADRFANAANSERNNSRLLKMYQGEHPAFKAAVYRPGIARNLTKWLDSILDAPDQTIEM